MSGGGEAGLVAMGTLHLVEGNQGLITHSHPPPLPHHSSHHTQSTRPPPPISQETLLTPHTVIRAIRTYSADIYRSFVHIRYNREPSRAPTHPCNVRVPPNTARPPSNHTHTGGDPIAITQRPTDCGVSEHHNFTVSDHRHDDGGGMTYRLRDGAERRCGVQ